jgi:hypothetical protein
VGVRGFRRAAGAVLVLAELLLGTIAARPAGSSGVPDPAAPGPYPVDRIEYGGRYTLLSDPRGLTILEEMKGSITLPNVGQGPFPTIVLLHGRHSTCRYGDTIEFFGPPPACPDVAPVTSEVRSYNGYDYLASNLASHGYVVASASANAINSLDLATSDGGASMRAQLLGRTLDLLAWWNLSRGPGEVADRLIGRVDLSRIGLMGHSRGGEGVTTFIEYARDHSGYEGLRAVLALAPTDFGSHVPLGVHFGTLLPLCDGDVSDLQGAFAWDRGRFADPATPFARVQFTIGGTNHNFFNTVWTFDDADDPPATADSACDPDSPTNSRLTAEDQRRVGLDLMAAFFRRYVGDEAAFDPLMTGAAALPASACPGGAPPCRGLVNTSYLGPAAARRMLIVPGGQDAPYEATGFAVASACDPSVRDSCPSEPDASRALQLTLAWDGPAALRVSLDPAGEDISAFETLTFRTAVNFEDPRNDGLVTQDVEVGLEDVDGNVATVSAADSSTALRPAVGDRFRKITLNGVRIPLAGLDVDLTRVTAVELRFGSLTSMGSIQLAELGFQEATL